MIMSHFSMYIPLGMLYEQYKTKYFAPYIDSDAGFVQQNEEFLQKKWKKNYLK